jgi:hypothetical protein
MKYLGILILVVGWMGCSGVKDHTHFVHPKPLPTMSKRCKIIGQASTKNVSVLIERNCMKNGVTTVSVVVLNKKNHGKKAALESVQIIKKILGFNPVLKILFYGKAKGYPYFLMVMTGSR